MNNGKRHECLERSGLRQQMLYDLARVETKAGRINVKRYEAV